jgi:hypothetical protein
MFVVETLKYFLKNQNILMMNTVRRFLKDASSIFSSAPDTKLIIRAIAPKDPLKCSFVQLVIISTTHFLKNSHSLAFRVTGNVY